MIGELTNHLWQSTLFAVAAGLLTVVFRKNRAQVRYWLWLSASIKFLVPFALLMSLGSRLDWAPAAKEIAAPAIAFTMQISQPFPEALALAPSTPDSRDWIPIAILGVWVCGFASIAMIRFRGWLRIRAAVRAGTPVDIPATVEVRSTPGLLEPGVVGLLRPILLLPAEIEKLLTPLQLEAVLAHELCHIRRRDNLTAAIHMIVEAMFWFHPFVWWIGARLVEERERACDEEVLRLGSEPGVYAEGILNVCKLYVESPLACVSGVTGSDLKKRIHSILTGRVARDLSFVKKAGLAIAGMTALAVPITVGILNAPAIRAQGTPTPKFEVASIKPCRDEAGRRKGAGNSSPGRLNTGCIALVDENNLGLIQRAYVRFRGGHANPMGILPIKGGPAWIRSDMYEINAKAEGAPSREMMEGPMLQALLEDRFKLKIHRETREVPVYELTVASGGAKLKPFEDGSCVQMPMTFPMPDLAAGRRYCKAIITQRPSVDAEGSTLGEFSKLLNLVLDRPVIDKTGLTRRFDIHVQFARDQATPGLREPLRDTSVEASDPTGPTIFTAIQQQLGLRLVPAKGPSEFIVIDQVERPSAN